MHQTRREVPVHDPGLLAACRSGNRAAQAQFFRLYCREVTRNLARILGDTQDLEDAVQDAFIAIFRSIRSFRGQSRLSTWMYRVCANVALQRLRRRKRSRLTAVAEPPDWASDRNPEVEAATREGIRHVYRLLERLSPKRRLVLVLHEIEGLGALEIAHIVGSNPLTVRTRLHYARKEFYRLAADDPAFGGGTR
jgi:RNA polymerase sigma-70 factor (ECF subfamily)